MTSGRGPTFLTSGPDQYNQDAPFAPRPDTILGLGGNDTITTSTLGGSLVYGDSLVGSDIGGNDVLVARGQGDTLFGGPGNDSLLGRAPGVALVGGDGRDTIVAEQPATLYGGVGRDLLVAVSGGNLMFGNQDEDTILGGLQGNDTIYGGKGDDLIGFYSASGQSNVGLVVPPAVGGANQGNNWVNGNIGNDTIVGINTGDSIYGGQDNDSIVGVGSLSYLSGDEGNDTLRIQNPTGSISPFDPQTAVVGVTQVTMMGGAGNDSIMGPIGRFGEGQNLLDGGPGNDTIMSFAAEDTLLGGEGDDFLSTNTSAQLTTQGINSALPGFAGGSVLDGGGGNDTLVSVFAGDSLFGGDGNDSLLGRRFSIMDGGDGNNTLDGSQWLRTGTTPLEVSLFGGAGDDLIIGARGTITNVINPGAGNDTIVLGTTNDILLTDNANVMGNDSIVAANIEFLTEGTEGLNLTNLGGNNTLEGSDRNDLLVTGSGNDLLLGGGGDDTLLGGGGNDYLFGGSGNDLLDGGPGDDTLEGGFGTNTLVGGEGDNQFFYRFSEAVKTTGADFITDFNQGGNDRMVFSRNAATGGFGFALVPGVSTNELGPNQFIYLPTGLYRDSDANINTPVLIYEQVSGVLKYDENGSAAGGVHPIAQFGLLPDGNFPRISSNDILIIE
ncbi:MAG: calcium-binding protein [Arthrospira sp. SH-MAG29]|nr:calcium-binding protein [Arthrospira sp. SH-MAG29]MBS0017981.1 calcium-binding protein [Arthrospira sp. SH-MAG29]